MLLCSQSSRSGLSVLAFEDFLSLHAVARTLHSFIRSMRHGSHSQLGACRDSIFIVSEAADAFLWFVQRHVAEFRRYVGG